MCTVIITFFSCKELTREELFEQITGTFKECHNITGVTRGKNSYSYNSIDKL